MKNILLGMAAKLYFESLRKDDWLGAVIAASVIYSNEGSSNKTNRQFVTCS